MTLSRRRFLDTLKYVTLAPACGAVLETDCGRPEMRQLASRIALPRPFQTPLPRLAELKPVRSDPNRDSFEVSAEENLIEILPGIKTRIWGYNGMFPGPTLQVRRGRPAQVRFRNQLNVPIVTHLHGGRTPPESDGYPTDLILPAGYRETAMVGMKPDKDARIASGDRVYSYPNEQRAATLWYHDHRMDFSGAQIWRGLAGFYILRDDAELNLPLPTGDKEYPLLICDRSFDEDGQLLYPALDPTLRHRPGVSHAYMGGVMGDVILVNGAPWPLLTVSNTRYRFRILNASNARHFRLALQPAPFDSPHFIQIGSDGGLLSRPASLSFIDIAPAERFDVIVDFSKYRVGSEITLVNEAGSGPTASVMRFRVVREEKDATHVPAQLSSDDDLRANDAVTTRRMDFRYNRGTETWTINGKPFDPARMDARPRLGSTEIWQVSSDFTHPVHLHLVRFHVLSHSGRPGPFDVGFKDTVNLRAGQTANLLVRFDGFRGRYVFHCHNLEHEDMRMMSNFEVI